MKHIGAVCDSVTEAAPRLSDSAAGSMQAVLRLPPADVENALAAWAAALRAVHPDGRTMAVILSEFGEWLSLATPSIRSDFWLLLPRIAPSLKDLPTADLKEILEKAKSMEGPLRKRFFDVVGDYGSTEGPIVLAAARIAQRLVRKELFDTLKRLKETITPEKTLEDTDSRKLLPATAALCEATGDSGDALCFAGLDLVLTFAANNYSSAFVTARDLPKSLKDVGRELELEYLRDFLTLARTIGIGVVAFGLQRLPKLYERYGAGRTRNFVEAAAETAQRCGVTAAHAFLEQRTSPTQQILSA